MNIELTELQAMQLTEDGTVTITIPKEKAKKWEPKGGTYQMHPNDPQAAGFERDDPEQMETAFEAVRRFARLLAYRDEFCPKYEPDKLDHSVHKYLIYYNHEEECWASIECTIDEPIGIVFPANATVALLKKLNSGEVVL